VSKKPIIGGIILAAIVGVVFVGAQINPDNPENEEVWSIRMASPEWHERQTVRASLPNLEEGTYKLGFVPMGDSPTKIRIDIKGKWTERYYMDPSWRPVFSEEFILKGTQLVSQNTIRGSMLDRLYYTWDYEGPKKIQIFEDQQISIEINPNGNLVGPVSLELIPIK